jgi:hypothetical protein
MSKISITKGKLLKGDKVVVEFEKRDSNNAKPTHCSEESFGKPHKDLTTAFNALALHAALLGEFVGTAMVPDIDNPNPELFRDFTVTGITISGGDEDKGVVISAYKTLKNGKTMHFNTPNTRFSDESEKAYPFLTELDDAITLCEDELREYLNGKVGPDTQGSLEFEAQ